MKQIDEAQSSEDASASEGETKEKIVISLRPLNMEDFRQAKNQVIRLILLLHEYEGIVNQIGM